MNPLRSLPLGLLIALFVAPSAQAEISAKYALDVGLYSAGANKMEGLMDLMAGFTLDLGMPSRDLIPFKHIDEIGLRLSGQVGFSQGGGYLPTLDLFARKIGDDRGLFVDAAVGIWRQPNSAHGTTYHPHLGIGGGWAGDFIGVRLNTGWMYGTPIFGLSLLIWP